MKKFLSVLLAVMMVFSTVSFAVPSAVGTMDGYTAPVAPETYEEADLAEDFTGNYGEIVFSIDFEDAAAGEIDLSSGVKITELGATINPAYPNAADLVLKNLNGGYYTEILDDASNYLYYTGVAGTSGLIYLSGNKGLTDKTGSYVLTFDLDYYQNSGNAATPITTRFTAQHTLDDAVENSGTDAWGTVTNENNFREFVARSNDLSKVGSIANVDTFKLFGNTGVAADDEFYIDNITLYYVSDTATVTVAMGDKGEDVVVEDYPTKGLTVAELAAYLPYVEGYKVTGFSATEGGAALESLAVGGDTTLYPIWEEQSVYGELVFELNFDKAAVGAYEFTGDNKYYSLFGGKIGSMANFDNMTVDNGSGTTYPAMGAEIVKRAEGDNYVSFTTNAAGSKNLFQITPTASATFVAEDGYFVATADVLWGTSAATQPLEFVYNRTQTAENGDQDEVNNVTQNGGWGTVVSYYDAEIGLAGSGGNATAIEDITVINFLKLHANAGVAAGETFGLDNIRLFWTPKTAKLTIKVDGQDDVVIENYPTTGLAAADLAEKLPEVENMKLVGFSLNPGGELLDSTRIARDTVVYPVYEERVVHGSSLEFNADSDISKLTFRTGKNNSLGSGFASIVDDSYMRLTFTATDTTQVVQDTGFNYTLPTAISAGGFLEMEIRVRFTGMPSSETTLNQAGGGTTPYNPASVAWPEMYYNSAAVHDTNNTISLADKDGEWFVITYTAEEMGLASLDLTQFRFDFFNYMPHGSTIDVDYIRFICEPEVPVCENCGGEHETADCPNVEPEVPVCGNCGGEHETADCPNAEPADPEFDEEWLGEYGELIYEIDFDSATDGEFTYISNYGTNNSLSDFGGKTNSKFNVDGLYFMQLGLNDSSTYTIVNEGDGNKYLEINLSCTNVYNSPTYAVRHKTDIGFTDVSGYENGTLIATYDVLADAGNSDASAFKIVFNGESLKGREYTGTAVTYPQKGEWGTVVSTFDKDLFVNDTDARKFSDIADVTRIIFQKQNSSTTSGIYGIDNIRLYWVPETVDITVPAGDNTSVSDFTTTIAPTATVGDLMALVPAGSMILKGLSLTEGGEVLAEDAVLGFVENTTLYPVWMAGQTVTVDMGDNTTATPVSMSVNAATTIGDVLAKIVDHGDKRLVGLSRTEGGEVLASTELINAVDEETTLYAIWEDYEYLTYYSLEFNGDFGKYTVNQNYNNGKTVSVANGILTITSAAQSGYTASRDHQIKINTFTDNALPSGVISEFVVRMRYRNVKPDGTYTTGKGSEKFSSVSNSAYVHIWDENGTITSTNRVESNIVEGQWFTRYFDASTYSKNGNGFGNMRFDTPYPMPDGMIVEYDFIRFIGDNEDSRIPSTAVEPQIMPNFSVDFDEGNDGLGFVSWRAADDDGNVTGFSVYPDNVVGKNSAYAGENYVNYYTWSEDGYVTINLDASADAKAEAEAQGKSAAVYDAVAYYTPLDKTAALNAGALEKVQMRMRFRGIPSVNTELWRADNDSVVKYTPASPFYFFAVNDLDSIATSGALYQTRADQSPNYVIDGNIADNEWFVVEFPASFFRADTMVLDTFRIDLCDSMPDGSKLDIDYIHFYGVEDTVESAGPVEIPDEPEVPVDKEPGTGDVVRALYSAEFNNGEEGVDLVSWKKTDGTYMYDDGVNGDSGVGIGSAFIGDAEDYITWNEEGYATINFVANEEVKAAAAAAGKTAYVYDASAYVSSLDEAAFLEAGAFDELKIKMRLRDVPANGTALYGKNYSGFADATWSLEDASSHFYFHYSNVVGGELYTGAAATAKAFDYLTFTEGSYVADEWFEVTIPASAFKADENALEILRLNIPDVMPDGAKIDIDYIRFVNNDADYSPATMNAVSLRVSDPTGIRFKATMSNATSVVAYEYGWVAADAEKVSEDALAVGAENVLVGYGREEGVDVKSFFEQDDAVKTFTLVIKNIKKEYADRKITVKPFVNVDGEYIYGDAITKSVKEIAVALLAADAELEEGAEGKLTADAVAYLNEIVDYSNT